MGVLGIVGILLMGIGVIIMHASWFGPQSTINEIQRIVLPVVDHITSIDVQPMELLEYSVRGIALVIGAVIGGIGWVITAVVGADSMYR